MIEKYRPQCFTGSSLLGSLMACGCIQRRKPTLIRKSNNLNSKSFFDENDIFPLIIENIKEDEHRYKTNTSKMHRQAKKNCILTLQES